MAGCLIATELTHAHLPAPQSFTVKAGESLCVQGKNGCGKSSLLKLLSGLLIPSNGSLTWQGQPINDHYRHSLAYLGHASGLKTGLTIEENWQSWLAIHQHKTAVNVSATLDRFQLPKHTRVAALSAGQRQKAALAKLSLLKKTIWILDEPDTALDHDGKKILAQLMHAHLNESGLLIMSTHASPWLPCHELFL